MDGFIHKKVIKVNDKVVLEEVKRFPTMKAALGNRSEMVAEAAGSLNRELKKKGSQPLLMVSNKPDADRHHRQQQPSGEQKDPKHRRVVKTPDIAMHLNLIESELRELKSQKLHLLNEKYNVEGFSKHLLAELAKLKTMNAKLNEEVVEGKGEAEILEERRSKLHDTLGKCNQEIKQTKESLRQKQVKLGELRNAEAKVDEKLQAKNLQELQAKLLAYQNEMDTLQKEEARSKALLENSRQEAGKLEAEVFQSDEMCAELAEKSASLQTQLKESGEEVEKLEKSLAETKKELHEKQVELDRKQEELDEKQKEEKKIAAANLELEEKLKVACCTNESLAKDLDTAVHEGKSYAERFTNIESTVRDTKGSLRSMELTIADHRRRKSSLVQQKEMLESENLAIDKKLSEMRAMSTRKNEDRKKLQVRLNDSIKACTKMKEEEKECLRQIEEIKRRDGVERANKVQLATNLKRITVENDKQREHVKNLSAETVNLESQLAKLQDKIFRLSEQEEAAKVEHAAVVERLKANSQVLAETRMKSEQLQVEKEMVANDYQKRLNELEGVKDNLQREKRRTDEFESDYCELQSRKDRSLPSNEVLLPCRASVKKRAWYSIKKKNPKKQDDEKI